MAPLLITGLTSVASNLIDSWNQASERKQAAAAEQIKVPFQEALNKATAMSGGTAKMARQVKLEQLRRALLDSPEIKTAMETADPSRLPTLAVGDDGKISLTSADGRPVPIQISPVTQSIANELASMQAVPARPALASARH